MKSQTLAFGALLGMAFFCGNGCSHRRPDVMEAGMMGALRADMPVFLTGPAGAVLAEPGGYSARVSWEGGPAGVPAPGQLLAQGGKFFYTPDPAAGATKLEKQAAFSYIWDSRAGRGYVLSEGLQAYAPVTLDLKATNVTVQTGSAPAGKAAGYPCESQQARVQMSDGVETTFQVLRALEPKGLPVRVSTSDAPPRVLTLSKLRPETLRPELFEPPAGFTKYENATVLADELVMRQRSIRRGKGPAVMSLDQ